MSGKHMRTNAVEKSWILYDVGNSAFVLVIITSVMPIFFKEYASAGIESSISTSNWAFANSLASLLLAISAPLLGTFADFKGTKKRFFLMFLVIGLIATFLLPLVQQGKWFFCLLLYAFGRIGFAGANIFYDAFLPDVTSPLRMDRISSYGFAWGYIGSVVPFLMVMALLYLGMQNQNSSLIPAMHAKAGFVLVGIWWLLFSLPLLKNVRQSNYIPATGHLITGGIKRFINTFREIKSYREPFLFLVAYFFYIDGVDTIITMATAYGVEIGFTANMLILVILMIQIVAFPFALLYGNLAERFTARNMLLFGIIIYCLITLVAFLIPALADMQTKKIVFWVLAFLVATSMGGIQALSRSLFGKLVPPTRSGEFFGFYNVFGKFAAISGPLLMGLIGRTTGHSRYGVLAIGLLLITGGLVLLAVPAVGNKRTGVSDA